MSDLTPTRDIERELLDLLDNLARSPDGTVRVHPDTLVRGLRLSWSTVWAHLEDLANAGRLEFVGCSRGEFVFRLMRWN